MINKKVEDWMISKGYGIYGSGYLALDILNRPFINELVTNCIKDLNLVEADQWISVETDLPQDDFEVLCRSDDDVTLGVYREDMDGSYYFDGMVNVTHWMHKPEPPK